MTGYHENKLYLRKSNNPTDLEYGDTLSNSLRLLNSIGIAPNPVQLEQDGRFVCQLEPFELPARGGSMTFVVRMRGDQKALDEIANLVADALARPFSLYVMPAGNSGHGRPLEYRIVNVPDPAGVIVSIQKGETKDLWGNETPCRKLVVQTT